MCLIGTVLAQNVKTHIPPQAFQYFPIIQKEVQIYSPRFYSEYINYFPSLIEHESCISLKHSRCFNPSSKLQSKRELGVGLGQITKTYREDGSIRFDSLSDLKKVHSQALKELSWENVISRPDLQIRAIVLMTNDNLNKLHNKYILPLDHIAMTDAAYNGGLGGVLKEKRACGLAANCDPDIWFGNVEVYCLKSKKPLYGNRSACDINRHHVHDVLHNRMPKYDQHF